MPFQPGVSGNPKGRPPGRGDKRVTARDNRLREISQTLGQVLPDAFQGDAHALLVAMYKDPRVPLELRKDAAAIAVRFEKPALSNVDARVLSAEVQRTPEQIDRYLADLWAKAGPVIDASHDTQSCESDRISSVGTAFPAPAEVARTRGGPA